MWSGLPRAPFLVYAQPTPCGVSTRALPPLVIRTLAPTHGGAHVTESPVTGPRLLTTTWGWGSQCSHLGGGHKDVFLGVSNHTAHLLCFLARGQISLSSRTSYGTDTTLRSGCGCGYSCGCVCAGDKGSGGGASTRLSGRPRLADLTTLSHRVLAPIPGGSPSQQGPVNPHF